MDDVTKSPTETLAPEDVAALRAAVPSADAARATLAGQGWDVLAWRVPAPDGDWLLRVPRLPEAILTIEGQHRLAEALRGKGVPLPREPRLLRGRGGEVVAGLYRFVDGREARARGRAARRQLAAAIAEVVSTLHALGPSVGIACGAVPYVPWEDLFKPMIERCAPLLSPTTEAWVREVGSRLARASRTLPPLTLVHADLKPAHVLLHEGGEILALLDFESARVSDPALEFSRLIQNWDEAFASMVLRLYRGPVDEGFMVRARCYCALDPLEGLDISIRRGWPEWPPIVRRILAARAGAATRQRQRREG